jgi:hypothetical protein
VAIENDISSLSDANSSKQKRKRRTAFSPGWANKIFKNAAVTMDQNNKNYNSKTVCARNGVMAVYYHMIRESNLLT